MENSPPPYVLTWKKPGETPLEALTALRTQHPAWATLPMAYAGRLDPLAQGWLLVLLGETCKEKEGYLSLDKEYEFGVVLGMSSDTQDILGITEMATQTPPPSCETLSPQLAPILHALLGPQRMPYPVFSSRTVAGKPLFLWALEERLDEITIPRRELEIYRLEYMRGEQIGKSELWSEVHRRIGEVSPIEDPQKALGRDFRRREVLQRWTDNLAGLPEDYQATLLYFRCQCSSGTYMRSLAQLIGEGLGYGGLAWSITRTAMGEWDGEEIIPLPSPD